MSPDRLHQIEELYHSARERESGGRKAFLVEACRGDEELRREVESLLAQDGAGDVMGRPAIQVAASLLTDETVAQLTAGVMLGPYEIEALLGSGGMGQVFRARDTRLGRAVAIKISNAGFSDRFEREARTIAALNHPNICHLYDVGKNYLVMELVDGPTLSERIKEGAIPLDDALAIAEQMSAALEAAHEKGITHRDLKPGNIKIRTDGVVKVLDFGLAKMGGTPTAQTDNSPTFTMSQTEAGVILGTAPYMSPEQAMGKPVDQRADIYAFGAVVYEMLTGKRLHRGATTTETLASVIKEEPQWNAVPPQVQRLLRRCLEKDPQKRLRHIGDVMALIDEAPATPASGTTYSARKKRWVWPSVAGLAVAAAVIVWWAPWRAPSNLQAVRFEIQPTDKVAFLSQGGSPRLSPDGRWAVFPGTGSDRITRMYIRALDTVEVRPLPGTEAPNNFPPAVFWSRDSRFIAFSSTSGPFAPGQLKKLNISGGPPETICDVPAAVVGGAWNRDGVIVFAYNNGELMRVSSAGGAATSMTVLDESRKEKGHKSPQFLPDGIHFLYQRVSDSPENTGIFVGSIDVKPAEQSMKMLMLSDRQAVYAAFPNLGLTGGPERLLFQRDTTLFAQPFQPDRLELSGEPVPVADQVGSFAPGFGGLFSISETGVLVYRSGPSGAIVQLTWTDSQGKSIGTIEDRGNYSNPSVSPDGRRIAVAQTDFKSGNRNLWILDTSRQTSTQLSFNRGRDDFPVWSPDGKQIIFASNRSGRMDLYQKSADGSGEERLLLKSEEDKIPTSWSPDGRFLLYGNQDLKTGEDLWLLPLQGDLTPVPFLRTQFQERWGRFSPDGRWIAYMSNESGSSEVYVRPFSPDTPRVSASSQRKVSKGFGDFPRWRGDGKILYYVGQVEIMAVDITADKSFQAGVPKRLFGLPATEVAPDVASDGKRFLVAAIEGTGTTTPFTVVMNWQAFLKK